VNMKRKASARTRTQYFEEISTVEINSQLNNNTNSNVATDAHENINHPVYQLEERAILAKLIVFDSHELDEGAKFQHRLATVDMLIRLGRTREIPQRHIREDSPSLNVDSPASPISNDVCEMTQCFFCFWNDGSRRHFSSIYKTRNHVKSHHLRMLANLSELPCPDPVCKDNDMRVKSIDSLKHHLATRHCYDIFSERTSGYAEGAMCFEMVNFTT
jgi:hypothetical protein